MGQIRLATQLAVGDVNKVFLLQQSA
jgi:hypothetical protein